uniref:DMRT like family B with proline rich C-terminal 1 n=1 Tax=Propithecus coquereli TaxID=379532 RepID=A0A2K6FXZ0_PROCO
MADKMLRTPKCSRCRNHGFLVPVRGHAGKCHWKQCLCEKCYLITERQKIMAEQKMMLKRQAPEEEEKVALGAQGLELASGAVAAGPGASLRPLPPLAASGGAERPPRGPSPGPSAFRPVLGGRGHVGPSERAALAMPYPVRLQLGAEAAGNGRLELPRPLLPMPSPPFADFGPPLSINSNRLYPMHPYRPFPLGYQDAPPAPGIPLQPGFRHVSCSHYHGGGLVSEPVGDFRPSYYPPPPLPAPPPPPPPPTPLQPQFLPPGFLSALHVLPPPPPPPPPPSFSLTILSDTDKENTDDQDAEVLGEPSQPSSQEQSD